MTRADLNHSQLAFVDSCALAMQHARDSVSGLILASLGIAQFIRESNYGEKAPGNNFGGIKAGGSWTGPTITFKTHEFINGQMIETEASFRVYDSLEACAKDYANILTTHEPYANATKILNGHQNTAWTTTYAEDPSITVAEAYIKGICGVYATDPAYFTGNYQTILDLELNYFDNIVKI